jgi:hypothetical protein
MNTGAWGLNGRGVLGFHRVLPRPVNFRMAAAAISFLACLAASALWWHSGQGCDVLLQPHRDGGHWLITSEFGVLVFEHQQPQSLAAGEPRASWMFFPDKLPRRWPGHWRWLGFDVYRAEARHYSLPPPAPATGFVVPHWFLVLITAILPIGWLITTRRQTSRAVRTRLGLCPDCGYDLRESPERCPECGRMREPMPASTPAPVSA